MLGCIHPHPPPPPQKGVLAWGGAPTLVPPFPSAPVGGPCSGGCSPPVIPHPRMGSLLAGRGVLPSWSPTP